MPLPPIRDSVGKCSAGNDIFAMVSNPSMKFVAKPMQSTKKVDTLETAALARLGKMSQNFIIIARAGKFIFLAIAMPPYILFYGLPKLIVVDLLPIFFRHFKRAGEKIKKVANPEDNKGLFGHIKNAFGAISTKATEYVKWINRVAEALAVHLKHQVVAMGYRFIQPYLPALQRGYEAAENATKILFQKTIEKGDKHAEVARRFVSLVLKTAKEETVNLIRPHVELIKSTLNKLRKRIEKLIEKPRIEIQKFKKEITHRLKKTNEVLKSTFQKIGKEMAATMTAAASYTVKPIVEWSTPKIQWTANMVQAGREKIHYRLEQIRGFFQNVASGVQDAARLGRQAVVNVMKNVFEAITPAFVKHFFNPEGGFKKKYQENLQNLGKKFKKLKKAIVQFASDQMKATKDHIARFAKIIRKFFISLILQVKQLPKRMLKLAISSSQIMFNFFIKMGQLLIWVSVLSRVLARLAWNELREKTAQITRLRVKGEG